MGQFNALNFIILRHHKLFQIEHTSSEYLKQIIDAIWQELMLYNISVVGVTTDNGSNLVKCF